MKTKQVRGLAFWASYLVNGDASALDNGELYQLREWAAYNGVNLDACLDASECGYGAVFSGGACVHGELATYTFAA